MVEVGTTNRTRLSDYQKAISYYEKALDKNTYSASLSIQGFIIPDLPIGS